MHDPDAPPPGDDGDWDRWFEQHYGGPKRGLLLFAVVMVAAMVALWYSGNSVWFSR